MKMYPLIVLKSNGLSTFFVGFAPRKAENTLQDVEL